VGHHLPQINVLTIIRLYSIIFVQREYSASYVALSTRSMIW
jgi:hypothetical protein